MDDIDAFRHVSELQFQIVCGLFDSLAVDRGESSIFYRFCYDINVAFGW
jgi:hypothetical protein